MPRRIYDRNPLTMKNSIFDPELFPTPPEVISRMLQGLTLQGVTVLEPSAGKGNLVKAMQEQGAQVIACERHEDLRKILQTFCQVIGQDFLQVTSDQVSHVSAIVMNPPFSNADRHILHAFDIAPPGCHVRALCNLQTVEHAYTQTRQQLATLINEHGSYQDLGEAFAQAERQTGVKVALIELQKPGQNYEQEFAGFTMEDEPEEQANAVIGYNFIRDLVNRYIGSIKIYDKQLETAAQLNELQAGYFPVSGQELAISVTRGGIPVKRNEFKKAMQKAGWKTIFERLDMGKIATRGLREDINKFIETQQNIPFTMANIYKMLEIVIGTTGARMDKALLEVFDKVTKHHHENRHNVEGWQTNSHYLLNRRFILPNIVEPSWGGGMSGNYHGWEEAVDDLQKALCYLSATDYATCRRLNEFLRKPDQESDQPAQFGAWYDWGFFKIKGHKKGTMHFEFLDAELWAKFNRKIAELKGYPLPEKKERTKWQEQRERKEYKIFETIKL